MARRRSRAEMRAIFAKLDKNSRGGYVKGGSIAGLGLVAALILGRRIQRVRSLGKSIRKGAFRQADKRNFELGQQKAGSLSVKTQNQASSNMVVALRFPGRNRPTLRSKIRVVLRRRRGSF